MTTRILELLDAIEEGYAQGKSGMDAGMLDRLIELGDLTATIRSALTPRIVVARCRRATVAQCARTCRCGTSISSPPLSTACSSWPT